MLSLLILAYFYIIIIRMQIISHLRFAIKRILPRVEREQFTRTFCRLYQLSILN